MVGLRLAKVASATQAGRVEPSFWAASEAEVDMNLRANV